MFKNYFLHFMVRFIHKELKLKNLSYYGRTVAYEVLSVTDYQDLHDLYVYEIKNLGTKEIKTYVSKTNAHFIYFGKESIKLAKGVMFCVKSTNKNQGRGYSFEKYVLSK